MPSPSETIAGLVTLGSWIALVLALSDRVRVGRSGELVLAVLAGVSTLVTFIVSAREHTSERRPRSVLGRAIVWAVILATFAGIGYLDVLAVVLRDGEF